MAIFQRRIVETRASFNFRASKQRGFAINVKSPRPGGYKFRGANKFRARLQGIKVLNGGGGGIKWMKRNEPHDFSAWTEFSILAPLFVHSTNSCILFFHYVSIYLFFSFLFFCIWQQYDLLRLFFVTREKEEKKKRTRKKLILPLYRHTSNRSYNYNMTTRFRYMKEKKKEQKKMEKEEEKKERK